MSEKVLLKQAYTALKAGRKQEARRLLKQLVEQQPGEFRGWLWLASVAESPQQAHEYVARAARLNPTHPSVAQAQAWVQERYSVMSLCDHFVYSEQYSVAGEQYSGGGGQDSEESEKQGVGVVGKRPFSLLLWGGVAALVLVLLLGSGWLIGVVGNANGRLAGNATADSPPAAPVVDVTLDEVAERVVPMIEPTVTPTPNPTRSLIQAKAVAAANEPLPTWTPTPLPTATPTATPTPEPTFVSDRAYIQRPLGVGANERWIDINLTTQTLTAYEGDVPVMSTLISSGTSTHPTVTGQFRVWHRTRSQTMDGRRLGYNYYLENVPYVMYFYRDYAMHGTYWHNNFGTPMSHGCVNMKTEDAEWIFNWSQLGTLVNVRY